MQYILRQTCSLFCKSVTSFTSSTSAVPWFARPIATQSLHILSRANSLSGSQIQFMPQLCATAPDILLVPSAGYKAKVRLKKRCEKCFFVSRKGRMFVECKAKPRHKQMQKMHKKSLYRED